MAAGPTFLDDGPGTGSVAGRSRAASDEPSGEGRDRAAEPSYYEIALTSRQVLIGFVILLASVVVAFFSGVWVGKSGETAVVRQAAAVVTGEGPGNARPGHDGRAGSARAGNGGGEPTVPAGGGSAKPLEEFQFFAEGAKPAPARPPAAAVATPVPGATELAPASAGAVAPPAVSAPSGAAAPQSATVPEPAPVVASASPPNTTTSPPATAATEPSARPASPATTAPPRPTSPSPAVATPPAARPAAPAAQSPAIPAGAALVQVFSSNDETQARKVLGQLQQGGYKAFLSPVTTESGVVMHRVRVGPFPTDGEARKVADQIKKSLRLDTWITH